MYICQDMLGTTHLCSTKCQSSGRGIRIHNGSFIWLASGCYCQVRSMWGFSQGFPLRMVVVVLKSCQCRKTWVQKPAQHHVCYILLLKSEYTPLLGGKTFKSIQIIFKVLHKTKFPIHSHKIPHVFIYNGPRVCFLKLFTLN